MQKLTHDWVTYLNVKGETMNKALRKKIEGKIFKISG